MKKRKRISALALSVLMLCQTIVYIPAKAANSAEGSGTVALGSSAIAYTQKLTDNGNGTYTLDIELDASLTHTNGNTDSTVSQNHYFTAQYSGYYLVELWGGAGAAGSDTDVCNGGTGGEGGHVYGKVFLNAGETLYYQLGGDGSQTNAEDQGGGANGEGGGHGSIGSLMVGGGGGYSAVYKFGAAEFEQNYTDGNGNQTADISEADRTSKYIMIAGGGGGGGAGDGWSIFGEDPVGTADGGAGGSMSSASGQLIGDGYAVQGTYYIGSDGKSSGTSTEYVGRGGTNVPGVLSQTITGLIQSTQPNDWEGAANPDMDGGSGGAGNMRGGAGGAGYCGGSGSVMTSVVSAYNIGGGGGGSSFVASSVESLSETEKAKLGQKGSTTGGAINIAFLGGQDFSHLENLTLSMDLSKYMSIRSVTVTPSTSGTWDGTGITGMNLLTGPVAVQITLQAAAGFAGGNNVPLFADGGGITCSTEDNEYSADLALGAACSYVNVPLTGFEVDVQNHTTNQENKEYLLSSLYLGKYIDFNPDAPFGNAADAWKYDFIESVDAYTVDGKAVGADDSVTVAATTVFAVGITVHPAETGVAKVGEKVTATPFTKNASITILDSGTTDLNGNAVKYYKELSHDGTNYILTLHTDISSNLTASATSQIVKEAGPLDEYTIDTPGYYYIQAWGGNGGNGYKNGGAGGAGGTGGYVSGYIYLAKENLLTGTVAANGADATDNTETTVSKGGGFSQINFKASESATEETPLMIAGGGGGGGNGGNGWLWDDAGDSGSNVSTSIGSDINATFTGSPGKVGSAEYIGAGGVGGGGGAAGANYRSATMKTNPTEDDSLTNDQKTAFAKKITNLGTNKPNGAAAGAIVITPLELESADQADIADYTINTQLSDYFVLADTVEKSIIFGDGNGDEEGGGVETTGEGHDVGYSYESIANGGNNLIQINNIDPVVTKNTTTTESNGQVTSQTVRTASFTVSFKLKTRNGFLGGNDVPVITATDSNDAEDKGMSMQYTQFGTKRNIGENSQADNANVTISADNPWAAEDRLTITEPAPSITSDESVARTPGLYTWNTEDLDFDAMYTWENDYVVPKVILTEQKTGAVVDGAILSPDVTTKYIVSAGLAPTKTEDVKAICLPQVDAATTDKEAIIYVVPRVIYQLSNLETSDTNGIWDGDAYTVTIAEGVDYTATLTPKPGYQLPGSITVQINGETVPDGYDYNSATGEFTIPKALIGTNAITIVANGGEAEYTITYMYEVSPGVATGATVETYKENASLTDAFHTRHNPAVFEHYNFIWSWETANGAEPAVMPAQNIWAIGTYVPKEYTVVVRYLEEGTNNVLAAENTETTARYGRDYEVYPVAVTGYKPTATVISGTMVDDGDGTITDGKKTVTFYYEAIAGRLDITYIYGDTHATIDSVSLPIKYGDNYSVSSPTIPGYTPDIPVVSGGPVSEEDAANGISVTVTYNPNVYTVTFDPDGGTVSANEVSREVVFNGKYGTLPVSIRSGSETVQYEFLGWYLGDTQVTGDTVVTTAANHTLTAKWREVIPEYILSIKYVYENGTTAAETVSQSVQYGTTYSVASPEINGYTPDIQTVTGTMGAQNRLVTVTYISNTHTLTVRYLYGPNEEGWAGTAVFPNDTVIAENNTTVELSPPTMEGYTATPASMSVAMGTTDQTVTFYYSKDLPVVSVTVEWGQLEFVYDYGIWNPSTHTYSTEPINPGTAGENYVSVSNNDESNVPVRATLNYTPGSGYENISAYFTQTDSRTGLAITDTGTLNPKDKSVAYLWLQGTMERGKSGTFTSGTCTVTITGGG